jgi:hypothetical protein
MNYLHQLTGAAWLLVILCFFSSSIVHAQIRWDGGGADGQWTTAANWTGDQVPAATDDVLLNNSIVPGNYIVHLPAGTAVTTVRSLTIEPVAGNVIEVMLHGSNTANPAFIAMGPGYGLRLSAGGIFRNASGVSGGETLRVMDSIRINNGGKYVHQTKGVHTSIAQVLSRAPGTEEGIFEFSAPAASSTVSLSNRTYGTLVFSAATNSGAAGYTSNGTNPIVVRGDLIIHPGVTLSLNFSDTLFIRRHFIQYGGTFNLGNSTRSLVARIEGDIDQQAGLIRESGAGAFPELLVAGTTHQQIRYAGSITDSVTMTIHNPAGVTLQSPVSLPYKLKLIKGRVTTSSLYPLALLPGCTLQADSLSDNSFINGPLRKEGVNGHFLFPVGKGATQRWVALKNATGNYTIEFIKSNPGLMSTSYASGIDHISSLEYWNIQADAHPAPAADIELSFYNANSGGVTDLAALRVAQLSGGTWSNAGNAAVTGTAGANGSVISNTISLFGGATHFTLASSSASANPLPLRPLPSTVPPRSGTLTPGIVLRTVSLSLGNPFAVVTIAAAEKTVVQLLMVNMEGRIVKTAKVSLQKGINTVPVHIAGWAPGIYTVRAVPSKGQSNMLRFVR